MISTLPGRLAARTAALRRIARHVSASPDWPLLSALVLGLAAMIETVAYTGGPSTSDGSTALLLNLLATLPLALRRMHLPATAVLVTTSTFALVGSTATWTVAGTIGQVCVLYLLGLRYRRRVLLLMALPFLMNALPPFAGQQTSRSGVLVVLAVAAMAVGDARRLRGQAIAERDASRQAVAEARRDQAAMGERARIARELHDVVAHHVSMIAVQAEAARLVTVGMPADGRQRLEAIGQTARDALTELRRLLGVMRADTDAAEERTPQPGLSRIDELVETARTAGTNVRLSRHGEAAPLPPGIDLSAYRIVQEALTNVRRHAPGADVDIEIRYAADAVRLLVRDNGPGPAGTETGGHGLLGMRERTAMIGGSLRTGPDEDGGFAVEAELPIRELTR